MLSKYAKENVLWMKEHFDDFLKFLECGDYESAYSMAEQYLTWMYGAIETQMVYKRSLYCGDRKDGVHIGKKDEP